MNTQSCRKTSTFKNLISPLLFVPAGTKRAKKEEGSCSIDNTKCREDVKKGRSRRGMEEVELELDQDVGEKNC